LLFFVEENYQAKALRLLRRQEKPLRLCSLVSLREIKSTLYPLTDLIKNFAEGPKDSFGASLQDFINFDPVHFSSRYLPAGRQGYRDGAATKPSSDMCMNEIIFRKRRKLRKRVCPLRNSDSTLSPASGGQ
jgi:hypothetical protein